jgi:hypothetical protein
LEGLLSTACENCFQAGLFDNEGIGLSKVGKREG